MAVSRFSRLQKVPVPMDMREGDKEDCGYYRSILWTSPPHFYPRFPDWNQLRHIPFRHIITDDSAGCRAEEVWTDFHRQKHQVKASVSHPVGTLPSDVPEFKRQGHQRNLQKDPPMSMFLHPYAFPWPKKDANIPPARFPRGEYYTYYHDAFHSHRLVHHRLLPFAQRIQPHEVPEVTDNITCKMQLSGEQDKLSLPSVPPRPTSEYVTTANKRFRPNPLS